MVVEAGMNEAKWTARKLQLARLGLLPVGMTRPELQREWKKLRKKGSLPALAKGRQPRDARTLTMEGGP